MLKVKPHIDYPPEEGRTLIIILDPKYHLTYKDNNGSAAHLSTTISQTQSIVKTSEIFDKIFLIFPVALLSLLRGSGYKKPLAVACVSFHKWH